jgi:DNA-binding protein H-NS
MTVDALLEMRDSIAEMLTNKANEMRSQLSRLGGDDAKPSKVARSGKTHALKGKKAAIKYRDKSGNKWAGRGQTPVWLRDALKGGAKLEDFAVAKRGRKAKAA